MNGYNQNASYGQAEFVKYMLTNDCSGKVLVVAPNTLDAQTQAKINALFPNDPDSYPRVFQTIAAANSFAVSGRGDAILIMPGTYTESVVATAANVKFIGYGPKNSVKWTAATDANCVTLSAGSQTVDNIKFTPPVRSAGSPAAIVLSGASYAVIKNCRFQGATGSYYAIYSPVCSSDNVTIENNDFEYMNTASVGAGIYCLEAGGLSYSDWIIKNNKFSSCVVACYLNGRVCLVQGNHFAQEGITAAGSVGSVTTTKLTLAGVSGTNSGANLVHGNYFGGTYSHAGGYINGTTVDDWAGNYVIAGLTTALPV